MQTKLVVGRELEVSSAEEEVKDGSTLFILVSRQRALDTALEELRDVEYEELRKTLEVQFYDEVQFEKICTLWYPC